MTPSLTPKAACLALSIILALAARADAVSIGSTGPGGLARTDAASDLSLWFSADAIDPAQAPAGAVQRWDDRSFAGNDAQQTTATARPTYLSSTSQLNGMPSVQFDGVDDWLRLTGSFAMTGGETAFFVMKLDTGSGFRGVLASASANRGYTAGHDGTNYVAGALFPGYPPTTGAFSFARQWSVGGVPSTAFGEGTFGIATGSDNPFSGTLTDLGIGSAHGGAGKMKGQLAEVILFKRNLNSAERRIVENYLSSKYNIALAAGDVYTGDTPAGGDYDLDVFGIGKVDATNEVTGASSMGLTIAATGALSPGDFVLAGHKASANGLTPADVPAGLDVRWNRVWYIDTSGGVGVTLTFDFSDGGIADSARFSQYALLYSPTNDFAFSDLRLPATLLGDQVSFTVPGSTLVDGYYTLAAVPEPSTFSLLLGLGGAGLLLARRRQVAAL